MKKSNVNGLQDSLKLIAKTSFIVFIGVVLSKILAYGYRIIVARYFGPEVYGLFSIALMVSGWFIALSSLGLIAGLARFIPLYRGKKELAKITYLLKFSILVLTITSIISGILMFFLSDFIAINLFHNQGIVIYLQLFSIAVPLSVLASIYLSILRSFEEISWHSFIFNIAQNVLKIAFLGLFVILGIGSNSTSLSYLLGTFGMLAIAYFVSKYKLPHIFGLHELNQKDRDLVRRELTIYSLPLLFFGVISTIFYWIDSFSLGYYKGAIAVGFYNAAVPIALLLAVAPEIFMQLFFPMITKEYAKNRINLIEQLSKQVAKWILLVNIPLFAIMVVFPGALINILFGADYLTAEGALRILAISSMIASVFIISNQLISMMGKSKLVLMNIVIAALVNLGLNAILVPMPSIGFIDNASGLNGAAIATLISVALLNSLFMIQAHKHLRIIPLRRKMIVLFIIGAVPTALLFYLRTIFTSNSPIILGLLTILFIVMYTCLILLTKSLDKNDWTIIKAIWRKVSGRYDN